MTYVYKSVHATSGYLHESTICIVIRSAEWHRDGDLIGLAWSSNYFTAASALCRHWAMTPVWLFVLHRYKHHWSDLKSITQVSWSHRQSSWVMTQTFLWQGLTQCHLRQVYLIIKVQQAAFLTLNISLTNQLWNFGIITVNKYQQTVKHQWYCWW